MARPKSRKEGTRVGRAYLIHALVPYELRRDLYHTAKLRGISVSRLVRQAIEAHLAELTELIPRPQKEESNGKIHNDREKEVEARAE